MPWHSSVCRCPLYAPTHEATSVGCVEALSLSHFISVVSVTSAGRQPSYVYSHRLGLVGGEFGWQTPMAGGELGKHQWQGESLANNNGKGRGGKHQWQGESLANTNGRGRAWQTPHWDYQCFLEVKTADGSKHFCVNIYKYSNKGLVLF